ncbi:UNVERIFIED_CONTAM: hypothetical protein HDU68_001175 [Siphonaria sp. JEL0065]|nr:hypothetical protein HDU68_001175 [Siphonaria sp. JEL0065]
MRKERSNSTTSTSSRLSLKTSIDGLKSLFQRSRRDSTPLATPTTPTYGNHATFERARLVVPPLRTTSIEPSRLSVAIADANALDVNAPELSLNAEHVARSSSPRSTLSRVSELTITANTVHAAPLISSPIAQLDPEPAFDDDPVFLVSVEPPTRATTVAHVQPQAPPPPAITPDLPPKEPKGKERFFADPVERQQSALISTIPQKSLFHTGLKHLSQDSTTHNPTLAFMSFTKALEKAAIHTSYDYNWYSHATCLNNMAVAKRQAGEYAEALEILEQAWGVAIRALVDEKERLVSMGMYLGDGWMDQVIRVLDLENHADWIGYEETKFAMEGSGLNGRKISVKSESGTSSTAGSSSGSTIQGSSSSNLGGYEEVGVRKLSTRSHLGKELDGQRKSTRSSWGKDIEGRKLSGRSEATYGKEVDGGGRKISVKSAASDNSNGSKEPGLLRDPVNSKTIHGPPLVVFFLDILTNFGNVLFNLGQIEDSVDSHSNCLRLAENVLEFFPLDTEFRMSFPLAISRRLSAAMTGVKPVDEHDEKSFFYDPNFPVPAPNHRIHLSYLHRSIILAQARSLTHLGVCCQTLGLDDAAIQCNSHAFEIVSFYKKYGVIGGVSPCQVVESAGSGGDEDREDAEESISKSLSVKEQRNTDSQKLAQWEIQVEQEEMTRAYTREAVDPLVGTVLANFAASYYAKGRVAAAMNQLVDATNIFKSLDYALPLTHAKCNIYALKVEVGRTFKGLHWTKLMEMIVTGSSAAEEAQVYWQPIGNETAARQHYGATWTIPAWKGLKTSFNVFKERNDLNGMLGAMLNMASVQLINNQPFIALHILASLLTEETVAGKSLSSTPEAIISNNPQVPEFLKLHTHFLLCQAVYLLHRYKKNTSDTSFPHSLFPQVVFLDTDQEQMLFCELEPIQRLAHALSPEIVDVLNLNALASEFLASFHILEILRDEIVQGVPYSLLYSYIGVSGFAKLAAMFSSISNNSSSNSLASKLSSSFSNSNQHVFGMGVGIDLKTQQSFLIRSMMGKNDWADASFNSKRGDYMLTSDLFRQAVDNMDFAAKDCLELLNGSNDDNTSFRYHERRRTEAFEGFVASLYQLGPELQREMPPSSSATMGRGRHTNPSLHIPRFIASVQASTFSSINMFSISSDILVNTAFLIKENSRFKEELVVSLKIKQQGVSPDRMMKLLLDSCSATYRSSLGMCDNCLKDLLEGISVYDPEIVFVSQGGVVVQACVEERFRSNANLVRLRGNLEGEGKFVFPCRHFHV